MFMARHPQPRPRPTWGAAGILLALAGAAAAQTNPFERPGNGTPEPLAGRLLCGFADQTLTGTDVLMLLGVGAVLIVLGVALYHIALEDLIRRGLRPSVLTWTIVSISVGVMLIVSFVLIPHVLGLCLFAILAGIFLLYLIGMMLTGKILRGIGSAFLLIALVAVILMQFVL